jgi:hypothetical protein
MLRPTAFHTPPGMRLYRVSPATGLAAAAGRQAIYEGYKPGTEPGTNRHLGLQGPPDETPIRSSAEERPLTRERSGVGPVGGTGGLYWHLAVNSTGIGPGFRSAADVIQRLRKGLISIQQGDAISSFGPLLWCSISAG